MTKLTKPVEHEKLVSRWKKDPKFKAAYDALEEEFALFDAMLVARKKAGLTQGDVAKQMGTKVPAVARLESGGGKHCHSPSLNTLKKYAKAIGCYLDIRFVPLRIKR